MAERTDSFSNGTEDDQDRLEQAGQILSHLQAQLAELDRREQFLNQQMAAAMEQQRSARQALLVSERKSAEIQTTILEREQKLKLAETTVQQRETQQAEQSLAQEERSRQLQTDRAQFEQDIKERTENLLAELQERQAQREHDFSLEMRSKADGFSEECNLRKLELDQLATQHNSEFQARMQTLLQSENQHRQAIQAWNAARERQKSRLAEDLISAHQQLEADLRAENQEQTTFIENERATLLDAKRAHQSQVLAWEKFESQKRTQLESEIEHKNRTFQAECQSQREQLELENLKHAEHIAAASQEISAEREKLQEQREHWAAAQEDERKQLASELAALRNEFEQNCRELQFELTQQMQTEKEVLHQEFVERQLAQEAELANRNEALDQRKRILTALEQSHQQALSQWEKKQTDSRIQLEQEFSEKRQVFEDSINREREEYRLARQVEKAAILEQIEHEKELLIEERNRLKIELHRELSEEKAALKSARQQLELDQREQNRVNQAWSELRTTEKAQLFSEIEEIKKEKLSALDEREKHLVRREIDLQKRAHLHESHLERIRKDLLASKSDLEKQRQQQLVWKEEVERGIRYRLNHMKRFRDLISQREVCLSEEQQLFAEARRSFEMEQVRTRSQFQEDREVWLHQRATSEDRLRNREERLDLEYERLSSSHNEICSLSQELEELIQQAVAQSGDYSSQTSRHLNGILAILGRQKREADLSIQALQARLQEVRSEGAELSAWIEERNAEVDNREQRQRDDLETLQRREEEFTAAREIWNSDRFQAEQVIRELVTQLEIALDQIARHNSEISLANEHIPAQNAA